MTSPPPADAVRTAPAEVAAVDPRSFADVLARHRGGLGRVAATYARTAADRDDLLQEIALGLWRALPSFRGECSERTFVFRVAHNLGVSHALRGRRPEALDLDADALAAIPDAAPGPDASYAAAARRRDLWAGIRGLPLPLRSVLTLALEDLPHAEIAAVLGVTPNVVAVRLTRARAELRRNLGGPT